MKNNLFLLLIMASAAISSNAQSIKRVFPSYQEASDFKTINSYLNNGEEPGPRIIKRTHPATWNGLYFVVEFEDRPETFSQKISIIIDVITPFDPKPRQYTFVLSDADHFTWETYFGITGDDWPDKDAGPLAWKITTKDFEGNILDEKQSFLWE